MRFGSLARYESRLQSIDRAAKRQALSVISLTIARLAAGPSR
jgi:hypothetical protein